MIDDATIEEAGRRIGAATPDGSRVILFGSHTRGEADAQSDLDILVIEPQGAPPSEVKGIMIERDLREGRDLVA